MIRQLAQEIVARIEVSRRALALLRLPDEIRRRVDAEEIAARAGYELSKVENGSHRRSGCQPQPEAQGDRPPVPPASWQAQWAEP